MSIVVHHCDEAQRTAKDQGGKRSKTHYVPSHKGRKEKKNSPVDFLGLYFVSLNSQATQKNLGH